MMSADAASPTPEAPATTVSPVPSAAWRLALAMTGVLFLVMLILGVLQYTALCLSCSTELPAIVLVAAGVAWGAVCLCLRLRRINIALALALVLCSFHASIIVVLGATRVCVLCWTLVVAELVGLIAIAIHSKQVTPGSWVSLGVWMLSIALSGSAGSVVGLRILLPVLPTRELAAVARGFNPNSDVTIYLVVRRGCPYCNAQTDRMVQAMNRGLPCRALVVDIRSEMGETLATAHKLKDFPAYVAKRGDVVVKAQDGGTVESFLAELGFQVEWK